MNNPNAYPSARYMLSATLADLARARRIGNPKLEGGNLGALFAAALELDAHGCDPWSVKATIQWEAHDRGLLR